MMQNTLFGGTTMGDYKLLIKGKLVSGDETMTVINPATEEAFAVISLGGQEDTDAAVVAARTAFGSWQHSLKSDRIALLKSIQTEYAKREEDIAQATTMEMGAPITLSRTQQVGCGTSHIQKFIDSN